MRSERNGLLPQRSVMSRPSRTPINWLTRDLFAFPRYDNVIGIQVSIMRLLYHPSDSTRLQHYATNSNRIDFVAVSRTGIRERSIVVNIGRQKLGNSPDLANRTAACRDIILTIRNYGLKHLEVQLEVDRVVQFTGDLGNHELSNALSVTKYLVGPYRRNEGPPLAVSQPPACSTPIDIGAQTASTLDDGLASPATPNALTPRSIALATKKILTRLSTPPKIYTYHTCATHYTHLPQDLITGGNVPHQRIRP